jgi:MFS transporter, ACS family, D-galactonate transporter
MGAILPCERDALACRRSIEGTEKAAMNVVSDRPAGVVAEETKRRWRIVVALLMVVVGLAHFNRIAMAVAGAAQIIPFGGISAAQMGQVYSAFLLFYTLAMLPAGWLIDRFGARATLATLCFGSALGIGATSAVGLFCSTPSSVWVGLIVVRSMMGTVNAPLHPAAARMVFAHVPAGKRSLANGLVTFAALLGISATFYGFGTLADAFDWPTAFLITGALTLAVTLIWVTSTRGLKNVALPRSDSPVAVSDRPEESTRLSLGQVFRNRGVLCLTVSYAALGYFQYLFFYWIEYYLNKIQHAGPDVARWYTTGITLAMGVGMVLGGWLADRAARRFSGRLGRSLVPVLGMIGSGLLFEAGLLTRDFSSMATFFMLSAALLGTAEGSFWTTIVELGVPHGGFAAGLMNTGGNLGGLLSPIATPVLSSFFAERYGDSLGWRLSLAIAGAVSVVGALLWAGVGERKRSDFETRQPEAV